MKSLGVLDFTLPPNTTHSTEEVIAIGALLQQEFQSLVTPELSKTTPSGNWKSSLAHHALLLTSSLFQVTTTSNIVSYLPQKVCNLVHSIMPWGQNVSVNAGTEITTKKIWVQHAHPRKKRDIVKENRHSRKRREAHAPVVPKLSDGDPRGKEHRSPPSGYNLTPENLEERLKINTLTESSELREKDLVKLKQAVADFLYLEQPNSRKGVELLSLQSKILKDIQSTCKVGDASFQATVDEISSLQQVYQNFKVDLDRHIHGIWVAGAPPASLAKYVKIFLDLLPGFDFTLWVDKNAMGAAKFSGMLKQLAFDNACANLQTTTDPKLQAFIKGYEESRNGHSESEFASLTQKYEEISDELRHKFYAELLQNRITLQDGFFNFCLMHGITQINDQTRADYLKALNFPEQTIQAFNEIVKSNEEKVKNLQTSLGLGDRFKVEDVDTLKGLSDPTNYYNYQKEMLLRWNFPAASDIIRLFMLKERGGIYTDTDILPSFSQEILKTIQSEGQNRFFEDHNARRVLSAAGLAIATGEVADIDKIIKDVSATGLTDSDKQKLNKICDKMQSVHKEASSSSRLFQPIDTKIIRDTMPMLLRYQKEGIHWKTLPLNGFMVSHKDSVMVDAAIEGQRQAHRELDALRDLVREGIFFGTTDEIVKKPPETLLGDFEVKDFLSGGLFSEFRQDTVIPGALSTLDISGPGVIRKQTHEVFTELGPLGAPFLNGNLLSEKAYIGTFPKVDGTYDWSNPTVVGMNDVTPDDASAWCVSKLCVKDLLDKDVSNKASLPDKLVKAPVDVDHFADHWQETPRKLLQQSGVLDAFNQLINKTPTPLEQLKEVDAKINKLMKEISENNDRLSIGKEKAGLFSLQMQLAELIRTTHYPIKNQVHFSPNFHRNILDDLEKSIQLFLTSDSETQVTIWYNEAKERSFFMRDILSCGERMSLINSMIASQKSEQSSSIITNLKTYLELKTKEHLGSLRKTEEDSFLKVTTELAEAGMWGQIKQIEAKVASSSMYEKAKLHGGEKFGDLTKKTHKNSLIQLLAKLSKENTSKLKSIYEDAWEKRIIEPKNKLNELKLKHKGNRRVIFRDQEKLPAKSLLHQLYQEGYGFADLGELEKHLLIGQGQSGIFADPGLVPAPSENLISVLKEYVKLDPETLPEQLAKAYEFVLQPDMSPSDRISPELIASLNKLPKEQFLVPPVMQSVTQFGVGYATADTGNSGSVAAGIAPGFANPGAVAMEGYLRVLYELHTELHLGKVDQVAIYKKIQQAGAGDLIKESQLKILCEQNSQKYLSLSEIHTALTHQHSLSDAVIPLLIKEFPGIGKLFARDVDYGRPTATTLRDSIVVDSQLFRGIGFSKNVITKASPAMTYHHIAEQAKYRLLTWENFYNGHVRLWSEWAEDFYAKKIDLHPQSMIFSDYGRCLGLTALYVQSGDSLENYRTTQKNLITLSALFQQRERDHLLLSTEDNDFLNQNISLIEWLQHDQNLKIMSSGLPKLTWEPEKLIETLNQYKSVLVTTPSHSLLIQVMDEGTCRVTDANFGHADFEGVREAIFFTEQAMQMTDHLRERYGLSNAGSQVRDEIIVYPLSDQTKHWLSLGSTASLTITKDVYVTTSEKLANSRETVTIGGTTISLKLLYDMGGVLDGKRITQALSQEQLERIKLHGNLFNDFLERSHLDPEKAEAVKKVMLCLEYEPGTPRVAPEKVFRTTYENSFIVGRWKQQSRALRNMVVGFFDVIIENLRQKHVDPQHSRVKDLSIDVAKETFHVQVESIGGEIASLSIKDPGLISQFRVMNRLLSEVNSSGGLDFEIGLSVVSLIQYFRLVQEGKGSTPLAKLNLFLDIKSIAEITFGSMVQVASKQFFSNDGIQTFRLENHLAQALRRSGTRIGGSVGKALKSVAYVLELPVMETIAGLWSIYDSIVTLQTATSHSERVAAQVQLVFDSITLAITTASVILPPLIMAAGPIAAIGMGASAIAKNVAHKEELHAQWEEYKKYLEQSSRTICIAYPEEHLLDLSQNQIVGNLEIDLRCNPPTLKGTSSHNWNRKIGNQPHLSDRDIRYRLGYANSISPGYALARGYANSLWPRELPSIPRGIYETILLGYGITYRAHTKIEYLSNRIVWREAVIDKQRTLVPLHKNSTIIAGDRPLKVISLRLFSPNSEISKEALSLSDYTINLLGGPGGLMVQVGGAGIYKISTNSTVDNTLSFRGMPNSFSLHFNLSAPFQKIFWKGQTPLMQIYQKGINILVGSPMGEDYLIGNYSTTFYTSRGGGKILSGMGKVEYHVPRIIKNLTIFLTNGSTDHKVYTELLLSDFVPPNNTVNLVSNTSYFGGLYFKTNNSWVDYLNRLAITLGDGFKLIFSDNRPTTNASYHLGNYTNSSLQGVQITPAWYVTEVDQEAWQVSYPDDKSYPESIIEWITNLGWSLSQTFTLKLKKAFVEYTQKTNYLIYRLFSSYTEVRIPGSNRYRTEIYGSIGSRYILSAQATTSFKITLAGTQEDPETIDMSYMSPMSVYGLSYTSGHDFGLKLNVSLENYTVPIDVVSQNKPLPPKTLIVMSKYRRFLLEDILAFVSDHTPVRLFWKALDYARVDCDLLQMNRTVTWIPENRATNDSIILRLKNTVLVNKQVHMKVFSGQFVGVRKSDQNYRYLVFPQHANNTKPVTYIDAAIPGYSYRNIEFKPQESVLFFSEVVANSLRIKQSGYHVIKRLYWEAQDHITIEAPSALHLEGFKEYWIGKESQELTRLLMFHQGNLKAQGKDFFIRLFYYRERSGIGNLSITFKNFFSEIQEKKEKIASDQKPIINPQYNDYLVLRLGSKDVSLPLLISDLNSMHRLIIPMKTVGSDWRVPEHYWDLSVALLVGIVNKAKWEVNSKAIKDSEWLEMIGMKDNHVLPLVTYPQTSYQMNTQGDLFLTRLMWEVYRNHAFVITFESYRDNWEFFQHKSVYAPHFGAWDSTATIVHFNGPEIWHAELELPWKSKPSDPWHDGGLVYLSRTMFLQNEQLIHYDPSYTLPRCLSKNACILWDLEDRSNFSKRARMHDSRLMELCMKGNKWEIQYKIFSYTLGYLHTNIPATMTLQLRPGQIIDIPSNHTLYVFLTTTQNGVFERRGEDTDVYYAFSDIYAIVKVNEQSKGDTRCQVIDKSAKFRVVAVRSDSLKKRYFVLLETVFTYKATLSGSDYFFYSDREGQKRRLSVPIITTSPLAAQGAVFKVL